MAHKHLNDAERINTEILQEWLTEKGKQPVTWTTLIEVLRDIELTALAGEIEAVKCPQEHAVSVGQFHVATSHVTEKQLNWLLDVMFACVSTTVFEILC